MLANLSQVAMLAVVVYGYVNTVVPALQKEVLEEEVAKLQQERDKFESFRERTEFERSELLQEVERLREVRIRSQSELVQTRKESEELRERVSAGERRLRELSQQTSENQLALNQSSEKLYQILKGIELGLAPLSAGSDMVLRKHFSEDSPIRRLFEPESVETLSEDLRYVILDPVEIARTRLQQLREAASSAASPPERQALERIASEFDAGFRTNIDRLACPEPDIEGWVGSFRGALSKAEGLSKRCTHSQCERNIIYSLKLLFKEKWSTITHSCDQRASNLSKIILDPDSLEALPPILDLSPPNELQVLHVLEDAFK